MPLEPQDKKLIFLLSGDLGSSERPYLELARKLNLTEEQVLLMIEGYQRSGLIRRLGAIVVHQRSGFRANAMVVWEVSESEIDRSGQALAGLPYVSHCYLRPSVEGWPFNLYTMIHAKNKEELSHIISEMVSLVTPINWKVLESIKELKKTSLNYFYDSI
ncbi:MAG: Lrp/AsnC family transcriptional regulator [Deltaproteobacteria bacterium]|jgi:DNA-binding Lrp family transcriptional regulator|nr:Lrp/AsnC family transcriptional regulator [Deltaproteobacteria bacterium]